MSFYGLKALCMASRFSWLRLLFHLFFLDFCLDFPRGDGDLGARHVQEVLAQLVSGSLPQLEAPAMIPNFLAHPRSADEAAAARLLAEVPVVQAEKKADEPCVVCRDDIKVGQLCRRLPCLHLFHKECIDQWIAVKAGRRGHEVNWCTKATQ